MSGHVSQTILSLALGAASGVIIVVLARRGRLTMRYTLGWLFVAVCTAVGGALSSLIDPAARWLGVSSTALVVATGATGLLALTVQLSITVSGLIEHVRTLNEASALLEERLNRGAESGDTASG